MSFTTVNKAFIEPAINDTGWGSTLNTLFTAVDTSFGGVTTIASPVTATLTSAQYAPPIIKLSGAITANVVLSLPSGVGGFWYIYNGCTGAYTVTLASLGGGTSAALSQGYYSSVVCDGTNVTFQSTLPGAASGASTQIQYNNGGVLAGSASLTYGALTASFTGSIASLASQLVITGVTGTVYPGMTLGTITGGTFVSPTTVTITGQVSGPTGGAGTYSLSQTNTAGTGATVASASITALSTPNIIGSLTGTAQAATYAGATAYPVGYVNIPQTTNATVSSSTDGYHVYTSSNITVTGSSFAKGDAFLVVNSGASPLYLIPGASTTLQLAANTAAAAQNYTVGFTNGSANITGSNLPPVGSVVQLSTTGTLPTGFSSGTNYYVVSNTSNTTITLSATLGGTAITAGSAGTGTQAMTSLRTVSAYGQAVVLCTGSNAFYISGQGAS
jgi:hypothetical protein